MNDLDKKAFAEIMTANGEIYNKQISTALMKTYFNALKGLTIDQVSFGLQHHVLDPEHGSYFPKPADIVRHLTKQELEPEEQAEIAWAEIESKIRTVGSYGNLELEDGVALAALKGFTSWKDLCMMEVTKMTWAKKEFISLYKTYSKAPIESLPKSLPGRVELEKSKATQGNYLADMKAKMINFKDNLNS